MGIRALGSCAAHGGRKGRAVNRKIPTDAFEFYFSLGTDRSYESVAENFGVTKRAVSKRATKEQWLRRIAERERRAREATDQKAVESLEQMNSRHLRSLRAVQGKALDALRTMPLTSAMDAVRALDLSIKQERLVRGEPTDRSKISIEEVIRREYERWLGDDDEYEDSEN